MKKRKLLFTMLALSLGCLLGGSGAMAQAGIELAEGNTLYIIGSGDGENTTVTAKGGKAANGVIGNNGYDREVLRKPCNIDTDTISPRHTA